MKCIKNTFSAGFGLVGLLFKAESIIEVLLDVLDALLELIDGTGEIREVSQRNSPTKPSHLLLLIPNRERREKSIRNLSNRTIRTHEEALHSFPGLNKSIIS